MLAVAVGLVLVVGAILHLRGQPPGGPSTPGQLVVASYNIEWGNHDWRGIADLIAETDADIVLIQESSVDAEGALPALLARRYRYMEFRNASSNCGFAILSRLPIRNVRTRLRDNGTYYLVMLAEVDFDGHAVSLASVHLRYKQLLVDTESVRMREIREIYAEQPAGQPAIVAGDFNSFSSQGAPTFLRERGLIDSFDAVHPGSDEGTWRWRKGPLEVTTHIDYIFHSGHFRATQSRIIHKGASDHWPVVSTLQWVGQGGGIGAEEPASSAPTTSSHSGP